MKKFYLFSLGLLMFQAKAQDVIFAENFGTVSETTPIASHTFQNQSPVFFSGNADVRISTPSTGYDGASGDACMFIGGTTPTRFFIVEGIDTSEYQDIFMTLGHFKSTNAGNNELLIEVSADGENWSNLTYTRQTGAQTSNWIKITPSGDIPATENLRIRITNPSLSVGFRVDDLTLLGNVLGIAKNSLQDVSIYPNPVSGSAFTVKTAQNGLKDVVLYDVLGKEVLKIKTDGVVNVSNLTKGIYVAKITENGKTATRKVVVK